jgi:hypothetical protein
MPTSYQHLLVNSQWRQSPYTTWRTQKKVSLLMANLILLVGATGFEPATTRPPEKVCLFFTLYVFAYSRVLSVVFTVVSLLICFICNDSRSSPVHSRCTFWGVRSGLPPSPTPSDNRQFSNSIGFSLNAELIPENYTSQTALLGSDKYCKEMDYAN